MIADIGSFSMFLALGLAVYGAAAAVIGGRTGRPTLLWSARNAALAHGALVLLAVVMLEAAFIRTDLSIRYVALNSSRATPLPYRISGLWGSLEGSILLWEFYLCLYTAIVILLYRRRHGTAMPYVMAILLTLSAFFLFVMVVPSSPFRRLDPIPPDGRGLNPLLQDPGMAMHPPTLYLGFVGFSVPYAFAMAALILGRVGEEWLVTIRRWTVAAWYCLTLGILMGAWWSYHVLGWGGYWAWDPVENASLMPWLTGTAFLHSVMIQERRKMLRVWNLTLIIVTFTLTLFGTFLTRSGILSSVHAFSLSNIGPIFLSFIGAVLLCSLTLLVVRADKLRAPGQLDSLVSRESAFLLNNVVLVGAAFSVFLGTTFPLISEAIRGVKVSVGAPFFNQVNIPIAMALLLLMGIGPLIAWRRASLDNLRRNFLIPLAVGLLGVIVLSLLGVEGAVPLLSFGLCIFVAATVAFEFARGTRARMHATGEGLLTALATMTARNRRRYGGFVVHLGVVLAVLGITASGAYTVQKETTLRPGEALTLGRYAVVFRGLSAWEAPNRFVVEGAFTLFGNGEKLADFRPTRDFFPQEQQPIAKPAIRSTLRDDVYLVLEDFPRDGSAATIRLIVNPMIKWIWVGGAVITLGTLLAIWPDRRRAMALPAGALARA